jgi:hypothetical protein
VRIKKARIKKARIKKMALYRELSSEFEKIKMRTELSPIGFPFTGAKLGLLARPYKYIEKEA